MNITIFTMAYNEELMLPYFFKHYKSCFPSPNFVFYDNQSTDNSRQIAIDNGCKVIEWNTDSVIDDEKMKDLKNNCWRDSESWIIVVDPDEILNINEEQLKEEEMNGTTIIKSFGYNMVNLSDDLYLDNIKYGVPEPNYSKDYMFNSKFITDINYNHGCHKSNPIGQVKYSEKEYLLYHYKYINVDWLIKRTMQTYNRLSQINFKNGWGVQWHQTEEQIKNNFEEQRKKSVRVKE